jgi:predicted RNA-binding Zn-ribbon protein involved in translation (DUF1610 family)
VFFIYLFFYKIDLKKYYLYILMPPRSEATAWRWNEDGTYNSKPNDPNYFNNYLKNKTKFIKYTCDYCGSTVERYKKARHFRTTRCINAAAAQARAVALALQNKEQALHNRELVYDENVTYSEFD